MVSQHLSAVADMDAVVEVVPDWIAIVLEDIDPFDDPRYGPMIALRHKALAFALNMFDSEIEQRWPMPVESRHAKVSAGRVVDSFVHIEDRSSFNDVLLDRPQSAPQIDLVAAGQQRQSWNDEVELRVPIT